jgi:exopolyphosphatase / guanosine-5'-triphosphate,3'-diphosphate pyrophosphatase
LLDLIGRLHDRDIRDKTVTDLLTRFNIDADHAKRVEATIKTCYKQLRNVWSMDKENDLKLLRWSALLHEVGLTIAHSQYHKHGAYLLNHSDLPGFSREEQSKLAFLVRCHRRKFSLEDLQLLPEESHEKILRLAVLLRLCVLLNRSRSASPLPEFSLSSNNGHIEIKFPENWLAEHPLTEADLNNEAEYLSAIKITLAFS